MLVERLHFIPGVVPVFDREARGQGKGMKESQSKNEEPEAAGSTLWSPVWPSVMGLQQSNAKAIEGLLWPPPHARIASSFPTAR